MTETDVVSILPELKVPLATGTKQIQSGSPGDEAPGSRGKPR